MTIRKLVLPMSCALFLMMSACTETPKTVAKKEPEKPLDPVGGQSAVYKMYQAARSWAPDLQVLKVSSMLLDDVGDIPRGKAAAWESTFVSETKRQSKSYTYSIKEVLPSLRRGIYQGSEQGWSPGGNSAPFPVIAVKIETDAAYETALKNGGADYDKKNPGKRITLVLEKISKHPDPVWRVVWGDSVGTSNFSVYVDASTGEFMEKVH